MSSYDDLTKEELIYELEQCDEDILYLSKKEGELAKQLGELEARYWKVTQEHQADLQMIHDRQKRERDEFRILDRITGELVTFGELPADLSNAVTIEHRRVTSWQGVSVSEEEDVEGN